MKKLLLAIVALGVVAIVAVWLLVSNLDAIVKSAIESEGSKVLGTRVSVDTVKLELTAGKASILGLRVANPPAYGSDDAFALGEITVQIDPQSVGSQPLVLPKIKILAPEVSYILDERGNSNIDVLLANVNRGSDPAASEPATGESEAAGEPMLIAIDKFVFDEGKVVADLRAMGGSKIEAKLPAVRMTQLGGASGAPPSEIGTAIAKEFLSSTTQAVATEQANKLLKGALPKDISKALGKDGAGAADMLDGFLGKKKKKK